MIDNRKTTYLDDDEEMNVSGSVVDRSDNSNGNGNNSMTNNSYNSCMEGSLRRKSNNATGKGDSSKVVREVSIYGLGNSNSALISNNNSNTLNTFMIINKNSNMDNSVYL